MEGKVVGWMQKLTAIQLLADCGAVTACAVPPTLPPPVCGDAEVLRRVDEIVRNAQSSGAVLLIDEGEALFSRRTEIADAHDRYAASPLDAVVTRLSAYPGPVLVVPPDPDSAPD